MKKERIGDSITCQSHKSFNNNLFMTSAWKNGMFEYWNIEVRIRNKLFKLSKTPQTHHSIFPLLHYSN